MGYIICNDDNQYIVKKGETLETVKSLEQATVWEEETEVKSVLTTEMKNKFIGFHYEPDVLRKMDSQTSLNFEQIFDGLWKYVVALAKKKQELLKDLKDLELIQQDLLHEIETNDFTEAKGSISCKNLHDLRVERREVKNQLEKVFLLEKQGFTIDSLQQLNSIENVQNGRKYSNKGGNVL